MARLGDEFRFKSVRENKKPPRSLSLPATFRRPSPLRGGGITTPTGLPDAPFPGLKELVQLPRQLQETSFEALLGERTGSEALGRTFGLPDDSRRDALGTITELLLDPLNLVAGAGALGAAGRTAAAANKSSRVGLLYRPPQGVSVEAWTDAINRAIRYSDEGVGLKTAAERAALDSGIGLLPSGELDKLVGIQKGLRQQAKGPQQGSRDAIKRFLAGEEGSVPLGRSGGGPTRGQIPEVPGGISPELWALALQRASAVGRGTSAHKMLRNIFKSDNIPDDALEAMAKFMRDDTAKDAVKRADLDTVVQHVMGPRAREARFGEEAITANQDFLARLPQSEDVLDALSGGEQLTGMDKLIRDIVGEQLPKPGTRGLQFGQPTGVASDVTQTPGFMVGGQPIDDVLAAIAELIRPGGQRLGAVPTLPGKRRLVPFPGVRQPRGRHLQ